MNNTETQATTPNPTIRAPFNFVPLEDTVFFPSWQNRISQDVPFSDSVSGSIDISIEAKTPIFVRNGQRQLTAEEKKKMADNSFSHIGKDDYFIPGTSIKGELRSVLEILSFGKMTQVQDARFGIRDLSKSPDGFFYRDLINGKVQCGWLYKTDNNSYEIQSCGTPWRISSEDIDEHFGCGLHNFQLTLTTKRDDGVDKNVEEELKSSLHKYKLLKVSDTLKKRQESFPSKLHGHFSFKGNDRGRLIYEFDNSSEKSGTIIVTGQSTRRKEPVYGQPSGKYYEFIFPDITNPEYYSIDEEVIKDFKTIHKNNYDFTHLWSDRLDGQNPVEVPVFFTLKNGEIDAIGLSYMFRYPSANSTRTAIPAMFQSKDFMDLADCMFGRVSGSKGSSLKGRVYISPAFFNGNPEIALSEEKKLVLSSPKPSYGPLYVDKGSWMDINAKIKGRKRYPIRKETVDSMSAKDVMTTTIIPLPAGCIFTSRIHFHNLNEVELGGLIAAITFNGHKDCFHSIGSAKPYGYGAVKVSITGMKVNSDSIDSSEQQRYLEVFQRHIEHFALKDRCKLDSTASVKELIAMAKGIDTASNNLFSYMDMNNDDFKNAKDNKLNLPNFTETLEGKRTINANAKLSKERKYSKTLENDIAKLDNELRQKEEDNEKSLVAEINHSKYNDSLNNATKLYEEGKFEEAKEAYNNAYGLEPNADIYLLIQNCENAILMRSFSMMKERGDQLCTEGKYEEALVKYKDAVEIHKDSETYALIHDCEEQIKKSGGLASYLPPKLNSIKAYITSLDRWIDKCNIKVISDDDKDKIIGNINSHFGELKNADKRSWRDRAPKSFEKYLGERVSELKFK